MLDLQRMMIEPIAARLRAAFERNYGQSASDMADIVEWAGHLALENLANTDSLYHNVEHTIMVTLAGQEILKGKHLRVGKVTPADWLHFVIATLCHDIGYVRGVCRRDTSETPAVEVEEARGSFATGTDDEMITLTPGSTDAALAPYHVDRSKLFIMERFQGHPLIDAERICKYIEMTRFPPPEADFYQDTTGYGGLVRAADLIGQLGDPAYLRRIPALYYEFEETGANQSIGYASPGEMRQKFAQFFWNVIQPYIAPALHYLRVTHEGKMWIASLHAHVFHVEHVEQT